jgi:hypothetical protein
MTDVGRSLTYAFSVADNYGIAIVFYINHIMKMVKTIEASGHSLIATINDRRPLSHEESAIITTFTSQESHLARATIENLMTQIVALNLHNLPRLSSVTRKALLSSTPPKELLTPLIQMRSPKYFSDTVRILDEACNIVLDLCRNGSASASGDDRSSIEASMETLSSLAHEYYHVHEYWFMELTTQRVSPRLLNQKQQQLQSRALGRIENTAYASPFAGLPTLHSAKDENISDMWGANHDTWKEWMLPSTPTAFQARVYEEASSFSPSKQLLKVYDKEVNPSQEFIHANALALDALHHFDIPDNVRRKAFTEWMSALVRSKPLQSST